jgi:hypothetical protein
MTKAHRCSSLQPGHDCNMQESAATIPETGPKIGEELAANLAAGRGMNPELQKAGDETRW